MVRLIGIQVTVTREESLLLMSVEAGDKAHHTGAHMAAPRVCLEEVRGKCEQDPLLWFLQEGMYEAGQAGLRLANLNNFNGLWGIEAVSNCLVSGPEVIMPSRRAPERRWLGVSPRLVCI